MLSDIVTMALAVIGIIFILFTVVFKLTVWSEKHFTFTLSLTDSDEEIINRIYNIRSFCELCSIHKNSTVVLINYGAPEWFCSEILNRFDNSDFLKIVDANVLKESHTSLP